MAKKIRNRGLPVTPDDIKDSVDWFEYIRTVDPNQEPKDLAILAHAKLLSTRRELKKLVLKPTRFRRFKTFIRDIL
jgi:hypothetical protein